MLRRAGQICWRSVGASKAPSLGRLAPATSKWTKTSRVFARSHGDVAPDAPLVTVNFENKEGDTVSVKGKVGQHILTVAHENHIDLEGACEGSLACSTCHIILNEETFNKLPEPSDDENDMLDLAFGLTDTSRLGCQVFLTPELEGIRCKLPEATRNMYVDGHKPSHH